MDGPSAPLAAPPVLPLWPRSSAVLPRWTQGLPPRHVHVIPGLSLGGAERILAELARAWSICGIQADVVLLADHAAEHGFAAEGVSLHRLGRRSPAERMAYAAGLIRASTLPAYCHLLKPEHLAVLWSYGCRTVPVVHNSSAGWKHDPQLWEVPEVPFIACCGEAVAQELAAAGCSKPLRVLRHVALAARGRATREELRAALGADADCLLLGMAGRVVAQKRYTLAVRILAELRGRGIEARLVIAGAAAGAEGRRAWQALDRLARQLGVREQLVLPGAVREAAQLLPAYDVFLNTSLWEGVSVAVQEAVAAGIPVLGSAVGGQREAIGAEDVLLPLDAPAAAWADAVLRLRGQARAPLPQPAAALTMAQCWPWLLVLGPGVALPRAAEDADLLLLTGNLDIGGAQRSLCNLAEALQRRGRRVCVAVAGACGAPPLLRAARDAGVELLDVSGPGGLPARAGRVLGLVQARRPRTLLYWNMDAPTKLALGKVLCGGPVQVAEASPGPALLRELDAAGACGRALALEPDACLRSLDLFVAKYAGGLPPAERGQPRRTAVIPNGVPEAKPDPEDAGSPLPGPPPGADPALAVVTVGRLTTSKRPELLPLLAQALERLRPGATLTVVGGAHQDAAGQAGAQASAAWAAMLDACNGVVPANLHFAGPDCRVRALLPRFAAFYMVSRDQGCPNASLEAMAAGLPVVANPDGGTAEQVEDGVTGLLVEDPGEPQAYAGLLAQALQRLLCDPEAAARMGAAGRRRIEAQFSMQGMGGAYDEALFGDRGNRGDQGDA